ncbi:MAG: gamma-glutamylcyclotransferase family protein [Burkholderiaceae bacterium]
MALLFVYGSLKQGFPNFHVNKGRRVPGEFRTVQAHPLYLANGHLPCLLPLPGQGHRVLGQLFEVNVEELAAMDALERVGEPGGYERATIDVVPADEPQARAVQAFVYMQSRTRLDVPGTHVGPLAEYTLEHAKGLRW